MPPAKGLGRLLAPLRGAAAPRRPSSFLWGLVLQPLLGVVTPNPRPASRASSSARQLVQPRSNFWRAELVHQFNRIDVLENREEILGLGDDAEEWSKDHAQGN